MSRCLACIAVLLLVGSAWAQSKGPTKAPAGAPAPESAETAAFRPIISRFPLQADSVVTLDQFNGKVPSETKCDPDGNVYGAFAAGSANSITRISTDGSQPTSFSLSAVPDLGMQNTQNSSPPTLAEFAIGTDGSVYLLVLMRRQDSGSSAASSSPRRMDPSNFEYRVISFNSDGKYHSQFKLDQGLAPNRIAVFSSGDLMLAGTEPDPEDDNTRIPFAGVFDSSGRFMKDISMPRDLRSPDGNQSQFAAAGGSWNRRGSFAVRGNAQGANDGNVYLLPNAAGAPVYVLSPGGEIVRTIKLESEANERLGMSVAAGRLISWCQHVETRRLQRVNSPPPPDQTPTPASNDSLFRIFNLQSGELAAEYNASPDLGTFACYSSGDFTFLRLDPAHHLQVVTASSH
jgi:hypothetical protein